MKCSDVLKEQIKNSDNVEDRICRQYLLHDFYAMQGILDYKLLQDGILILLQSYQSITSYIFKTYRLNIYDIGWALMLYVTHGYSSSKKEWLILNAHSSCEDLKKICWMLIKMSYFFQTLFI